ncbi:hypothetical protein [Streptomyces sp. T028]|uniref:hypothetical protein n=1 Tax=Streptomyces sp. T028 TaxID=3394379 RepID=UPI003A878D58
MPLRRRTLLASTAGAALLVGCSSGGDSGDGGESVAASPSVTEVARARAARESTDLVERYDAVLAAHPTLTARLAPLRAEVVRHVEAFGGAEPTSTATQSTSSTAPTPSAVSPSVTSPSATPATGATAAPTTAKDALTGLAAAERELADRRTTALLEVPGELARLLASVAAAGAAHAYLLTEAKR